MKENLEVDEIKRIDQDIKKLKAFKRKKHPAVAKATDKLIYVLSLQHSRLRSEIFNGD